MTENENTPDYGELLRSPYDPDPAPQHSERNEGDSDLPWKPAVVSAIIGALVVSAFVIFAVVSEPANEGSDAEATTTISATDLGPVAGEGLPIGFTEVTEAVGARVETVDVSQTKTSIAVSTAVPGSMDPATTPPLDVAYWEMITPDGSREMLGQYPLRGTLGSLTLEFEPDAFPRTARILPYLPVGSPVERVVALDVPATVPATVENYQIDMGAGRIIEIDSLVIGDGWGHVAWSAEGGFPAKVAVIVRFVGTDDPSTPDDVDETTLTPAHLRTLNQGSGVISLAPLYGFAGREQLIRSGEPLGAGNEPEAIIVEFTVVVPDEMTPGLEIQGPSAN